MKAISQLLVHVFDLIEAEGNSLRTVIRQEARCARSAAASLVMGFALLLISIPLMIGGFLLLAAALMWWLETQIGRPLAALLAGLLMLAIGAGCIYCFKFLTGKGKP